MAAKSTLQDEWGLFTIVPNEFIQNSADLSDHARWMFVLLRFHTNKSTNTAFPSYELLKRETGWAYNTIAKAIKGLEEAGWLTRKKQFSGNTHYTLVRRPVLANDQSLPIASNDQSLPMTSPCQSQGQSLPIARPVLANSKPTKTKNTKTKITKTDSPASQAKDEFYKLFTERYQQAYGCPYQNKPADFMKLAACRKQGGDWLTTDRWLIALGNYFASPLGTHTLPDLSVRFGTFFRSALDRYGKPAVTVSTGLSQKTQSNLAAAQAFLARHGQALEDAA